MTDSAYSTKESNYFEDNRKEMIRFIPQTVKKLLEVGCGNAAFAANLKSQRDIHITAIEAFEPAAKIARSRIDRVIETSIENAIPELLNEKFDCIVLNDVLEHLIEPWEVLASLRPLLAQDGTIVASIPNVRYLPVLKDYFIHANWTYKDYGVLDRTHVRFFTQNSIRTLFEQTGYRVSNLEGINGLKFSWKMQAISWLFGNSLEDTRFKQFACTAKC